MSLIPSLTRRARSTIAGSLVAISAAVPAASIATEPDSAQEGLVAPEQEALGERPSFDPGGETALPIDAAPPASGPPGSGSPEEVPLESEPIDDPDIRIAPLAEPEGPGSSAGEDPSVAPIGGSAPAAPPEPGFAIEPVPPEASLPTEQSTSPDRQVLAAEPGSEASQDDRRQQLLYQEPAEARPQASPNGPSKAMRPAAPEAAGQTTTPVAQTVAAETGANESSEPSASARFHVVRPGESLWAIAERLLGDDASTAEIADEVARLWTLNRDRIASGDANLIVAGTKLKLR